MILGAMFGGWVALTFPDMSGWLMMPAMILAGMVGGLLWAMIPAILKTRFQHQRDPGVTDADLCGGVVA